MLRAVIYSRTSTDEDCQLNSLENQVMDAKKCIEKNGWVLVDVYVESKSGTTSNRSEYSRLFGDMLEDKFDLIVTKCIDRLNRSAKNWYLFLDRLVSEGKKLYFYMENKFHTTDDALISGIRAILAEEYSRELSRKINHAHKNRQQNNGAVILTNNAYGFRKLPDKSVVIDPDEAAIKVKMYELCAAGYGCRTISGILANQGIYNRSGRPFTDSSILRIIRNPINKGTAVMGKTHFDFESKKTIIRKKEEWFVYKDKVPMTVSEELWELANRQINKRSQVINGSDKNERGKNPGKYHLSSKIICGLCGNPYYRQLRSTLTSKQKIYDWKCRTYLENGRNTGKMDRPMSRKVNLDDVQGCDNVHLEEENLNTLLQEVTEKYYKVDKENIIHNMRKLLKSVLKMKDYQTEMENAQKQIKRLSGQLSILLDKLLSGVISDELYQRKQSELEEKLQETKEKLSFLEKQKIQENSINSRIYIIEEKLRNGNMVEKAAVASLLEEVEKILIYPTYMELYFSVPKMVGMISKDGSDSKENVIRIDYGSRFNYRQQKVEEREIIVEMMREDPQITAKVIAAKLEISLSGVNYRIRNLKKDNKIRYIGCGGKGRWEVIKE